MTNEVKHKFFNTIEDYLKMNNLYFISKDKRYYCFNPIIKKHLISKGIEHETLRALRALDVFATEYERFTIIKRYQGKRFRVIAIDIEKLNALKYVS